MKYEIKISKAADMLNVSPSRISQLISAGVLDSVTIRGQRRISKESIETYKQSVKKGRPPKQTRPTAQKCTLMNADYPVARIVLDTTSDTPLSMTEVLDQDRAPWGVLTRSARPKTRELNSWWLSRAVPDIRPAIGSVLASLGLQNSSDFTFANYGLSLSDCYWLCPQDQIDTLSWDDINYFDNGFANKKDSGWDFWVANVGLDSPDNTSEGALPKKWVVDRLDNRVLLKGSSADDQRPFNEVVATALHTRVLAPEDFVEYKIIKTKDGPACACNNFLNGREEYIPAARIKSTCSGTRGTNEFDRFCAYLARLGMDEASARRWMSKLLVCDALIANDDRHWRNFGFIRNIDTLELRPAPIFDSGNSLWFNKTIAELQAGKLDYSATPFGPELARQLSCVCDLSWFDATRLDGFASEALKILSGSKHVADPARTEALSQALTQHLQRVSAMLEVLRYSP
jgi:excisionase family DNA binding protein